MIWTIILLMPSGKHHVGITDDPEHYLDTKNKVRGFFSQPTNKGKCKIIKLIKGDFKSKINAFGIKTFVKCVSSEDDLTAFALYLLC